jgi:hypothetical protein
VSAVNISKSTYSVHDLRFSQCYEECSLLGYRNTVRTSHEIYLRYRAQPVNVM